LDDLNKGVVGKFGDVALECSNSVFGRCICTCSRNNGYGDVLLGLATAGDLGSVSGAQTRSLWKGKAGETLKD
jgi:hypothetical protein